MRSITFGPLATFLSLIAVALLLAWLVVDIPAQLIWGHLRYSGGWFLAMALVFYLACIATCRTYLRAFPLKAGDIASHSADEFHYHVYLLFYLVLFQPLTRSLLVPVPLMRLLYISLGAKLGKNTYSAGTILDPPLTWIGDNTIVGHDALIFSHVVEGNRLALAPVRIGNGVTIGAKAVIMPGVSIGDGAIIGVGGVVRKNAQVGAGEVWTGNPARQRPPRGAT